MLTRFTFTNSLTHIYKHNIFHRTHFQKGKWKTANIIKSTGAWSAHPRGCLFLFFINKYLLVLVIIYILKFTHLNNYLIWQNKIILYFILSNFILSCKPSTRSLIFLEYDMHIHTNIFFIFYGSKFYDNVK